MRPLEPVELTLRRSGKRRVGTDCHWVIRDRAGESSSGVVLDGPVRVRDRFPQPYVEAQVPCSRAGIRYGVLHTVLRWTRGGEVSLVEFHRRRPRSSLRDDAEVGPGPTILQEIQWLGKGNSGFWKKIIW